MQNTKTRTAKRLRWGFMALAFSAALYFAASAAERLIIAARFSDTRISDAPTAAAPSPQAILKAPATGA